MKILWLTGIPSPYRVDFFNEVGKDIDLTVLFERNTSKERELSWANYKIISFKGIILKGIRTGVDNAFCSNVVHFLSEDYDCIIIHNYSTPTGILAIENLNLKKIPFIMEVDGGFSKSGKGLKEKLKKHLISSASWWMSTSKVTDETLIFYGAKKEKIYRYPFTSLYEKDILETPITQEEKKEIRKELNIKEKRVILAVGQFIPRKGFDILLKVASELDENIGIYIVGGEATKEYIDYKEKYKLENIHFDGFKSKEELAKYYKSADLFVLPTREDIWGLVINEAMAYGLPVITTDRCIAGLELITNGENGYVVPVENADALTKKIQYILNNAVLRSSMGAKSLSCIHDYTIENMAKKHNFILQHQVVSKL